MDKKLQVQKVYPLTSMQEGMLFYAIASERGSSMYCDQISFKMHGNINLEIFQRCFEAIIERYDVFRTNFVYKKVHRPVQVVLKERKAIIHYEDITELYENEKEIYIEAFKKREMERGFDLSRDLLLRLTVLKIGESTFSMIWTVHHIIIDGWCMGIVTKEFFQIYHSLVTGTPLYLDKVKPYEDFIHWLEKQDKNAAEVFWKEYLDGYKLKAVLPYHNTKGISNEYAKSEYEFSIDKDTTQKLQRIASTYEVTLNTVIQALYGILLQKYNSKSDVVFGSVVSGRPAEISGVESMVGLFINTIPVRVGVSGEASFGDLVKSIYSSAINASKYHYYPLAEIQSKSVLRGELFDSLMIVENYPVNDEIKNMDIFNRLSLTLSDFENVDQTNYPLNFFVYMGDSLTIRLNYNSNIYGQETISMLEKNLLDTTKTISENPNIQIRELEVLTAAEKKLINEYNFNNRLKDKNSINLVVSATFTSEPIEDYIKWWCRKFDTPVNISFAPYNQVFQELLDTNSLISSNTGMNILLVRFEDWIRDEHAETSILLERLNRNFEELKALIDQKEKTVPYFIGIFPVHLAFNNEITNHLIELGEKWKSHLEDMRNVYTVDFTQLEADYSFDDVFDDVRDKAGHIPFTDEFYSAMGTELARKICTYRSQPFKVIVLDCDNTLWKGICGEDGAAGITVDEAYSKLQSTMVQRSKEGMLLALCSKNNEADVWEVFEKNENMLLKKEHIAAWRINWNPKSENIKEMARELNLGIDSFIFLDDSPMECSEVMSNCPEALTLQLPQESEAIPLFLKHIWAFDRLKITEEDKLRTSMYAAEKLRKEKQEETVTLDDFLKSLELKMSIGIMEKSQLSRVSQLTQRTNQFNLSTIRRTEKDISDILQKTGTTCSVIEVSDRFGDYGLVGVLIIQEEKAKLNIETLLLSCRVLGRRIEDAILYCIGKYWREKGIDTLEAKFYQTEKNRSVLEFLERSGWVEYERTAEYIGFCMEFDKLPLHEGFVECYIDTKYTKNQARNSESKIDSHNGVNQKDINSKPQKGNRKTSWKVNVQNENNLSHKKYFLPLLYHCAQDIIDKSIKELYEMNVDLAEYVAPRNEIEEKLVSIWQSILGKEKIGINDNFFELGGHSLNATTMLSKIHKVLNVEVSLTEIFNRKTIGKIAKYIISLDTKMYSQIEPIGEKEYYPISPAQKRLYLLNRIEDSSIAYNMPAALVMEGGLDSAQFEETFKKLVQRHEAFRTSLEYIGEEPVQKIQKAVDFKVSYMEAEEGKLLEILKGFIRPFDLSKAPLLRAGLIKISKDKHILVFDMHHIISDGTSIGILINDFVSLYNGKDLPELRLQYKDFSCWQNEMLKSESTKKQEEYWLDILKGEIPVLNLPLDFTRPSLQNFDGDRISFKVDRALTGELQSLGAKSGATMYMVLLAAFNVLVSRYAGQEDIIVGSPIAGRQHVDLENIIGVFVNTLAIRNHPEGCKTFKQFLQEVKHNSLKAYENQDCQFEDLVNKLAIKRDLSRNPLFDVMLVLQNTGNKDINIEGLKISPFEFNNPVSKLDITLNAVEVDENIYFSMEYCTKLFKKETMKRFAGHFTNILEEVLKNPDVVISEIDILSEEEKNQILYSFNNTKADYPKYKTIHQLFEEQVEKTPDNTAVIFEGEQLTYRELNARANSLARILRNKGMKRDSIVGLLLERSLEMIIGIMAVLKAGGAYLPISLEYPQDRIDYMLEDSGAVVLLTCNAGKGGKNPPLQVILPMRRGGVLPPSQTPPLQVINLGDDGLYNGDTSNLERINEPTDLAYVIYTSGSTGKPKGAMIEHYSLINRLNWMQKMYPLGEGDVILQKTPYTFDVSVWELFWWSMQGAGVCFLKPGGEKEPQSIVEAIEKNSVTTMHFVPSMLSVFLEYIGEREDINRLKSLRQVFASGEALTVHQVKKFNSLLHKRFHTKLHNLYGPTEATVDVSYFDCSTGEELETIPIGKPIDNINFYVLDKNNRLQPVGVHGELHIAGDGLARGYLNRQELTAEKFVSNPFQAGGRMYKTGDLARWMSDGNIEYLGRLDHQVKIRGLRIELGEIETELLKHENINEAVVTPRDDKDGNKYLCAYIVTSREFTVPELREHLTRRLPDYMVPACFTRLEKMPLSANGKADRKALPEPDGSVGTGVEYAEPTNEIEKKLAGIWQEVLGVERAGINDNFFELGGHSLKATILISRVHKAFNAELPLREVFKAPTIKQMAQYMNKCEESIYSGIENIGKKEYYPISSAQKRLYLLNRIEGNSIAYNMPAVMVMEGALDTAKFEEALEKLVQRHESFRTSLKYINEEPVQKIQKTVDFKVSYMEAEEDKLLEILKGFIRPFDLSKAPLLRAGLIKISKDKHILVFDMHHIISDGTSIGILINDFVSLYNGKNLPELRLQYKDFSCWQEKMLKSESTKKQEEYWLDILKGEIPVLNLPLDFTRPSLQNFEGDRISFKVDRALTGELQSLGAKSGATMYMVLLAAFNVLISRYSGQEDIIVGSPIAGRQHVDLENIIGVFINTLAIRNHPEGCKTFNQFLHEVKHNSLKAYENQDCQFEDLVNKLAIRRDLSRNPLFDIMFILQNTGNKDINIEDLKISPFEFSNTVSKLDITLNAVEVDGNIYFSIEYCTKLFKKETMERFAEHLINVLQYVVKNPERKLAEIELLSCEDKERILVEFNDTRAEYPKDKTIHQLFEEQVERTPDNTALIFKDKHLTYRELNEKSNQLARILIEQGVERDTLVGILVERSLEMLIGIMGILKAGGAYLPLDPEYPSERIKYMLEDSAAGILLSQGNLINRVDFGIKAVNIQDEKLYQGNRDNLNTTNKPSDLAYVIYTSGSTGKPKGVMLEHKSVLNFIQGVTDIIDFKPGKSIVALTTICFDIFALETILPLVKGLKVIIADEEAQKNPKSLEELIDIHKVDMLQITPSRLQILRNYRKEFESLKGLKELMIGGESLPEQLYEQLEVLSDVKIYNMYGPTETTVWSTIRNLTGRKRIDIGKPLANTRIYIVDSNNKLQPARVPGELCIAGAGLARGYLNKPELTAEKFVPDPFAAGENMYKTGDLARWLPDGNIECLGRIDHQVKIRGFRIELGEIEARMTQHEAIKEAVVTAREGDVGAQGSNEGKYLCAYITADVELYVRELREYLAEYLPDYMIPSYFIQLEKLPLTPNGKVDRNALPKPDGSIHTGVTYSPPVNDTEDSLVGIWLDILKIEIMGVNDNFFELGGDSLKAVSLVSKIYEKFEIDISMNEIFQFPTIRGLGKYIKGATKSKYLSTESVEEKENYHLFCAQKLQYFYKEDGNPDDFLSFLPCTDSLLYFIMKRKLPDITKPYEIFVQDITFCLQQNEDDSIYDLNTTDYMINQDVFKTQYSYSGRGQAGLLEVEALLDRGELVIIQTYSDRLPFFKHFKGFDAYDEKFVPGHTFLAVGHDRERLYYVEAPWNININNFVSYKGNKSIGVISKKELKYAFDILANCVTVEITNEFSGVASLKNDRMKLAVEGTIKNYYKKSHTSGKFKISYGREAIGNLITICERGFLNLNQKVDSFQLKLVDLLDWKFGSISKTRGLLLGCLSKYADQYGRDSCYGLVDLLDLDLREWKKIIYTILQMEKKGEHMLDTSVKKNFMKIADIEEKIIESLQELKF